MEKQINDKINISFCMFKKNIQEKMQEYQIHNDKLIDFIKDYKIIQLNENDFVKKKRNIGKISNEERCIAKISSNTQCSRKKKVGCNYCGTHLKTLNNNNEYEEEKQNEYKPIIKKKEIQGIYYFVDEDDNLYLHEDILQNNASPKIIGYLKNGNIQLTN
jgi:hypothetical protein